jgi:hypothetical protein
MCGVCTKNRETDDLPSLPGLQAIYKGTSEPAAKVAQRKPW